MGVWRSVGASAGMRRLVGSGGSFRDMLIVVPLLLTLPSARLLECCRLAAVSGDGDRALLWLDDLSGALGVALGDVLGAVVEWGVDLGEGL
jgi:hypothetical protein